MEDLTTLETLLQSKDIIAPIIAAIVGFVMGGMVEIVNRILNKNKNELFFHTELRKELREELDTVKNEANSLEYSLDNYREKYYTLFNDYHKLKAGCCAAGVDCDLPLSTLLEQSRFESTTLVSNTNDMNVVTVDKKIHKLNAVWFVDIVGFTQLTATDEKIALDVIEKFQISLSTVVNHFSGRVVKFLGDGALVTFDSCDSAIKAALKFHEVCYRSEWMLLNNLYLTIGMHLGEIVETSDGDIYGDGVNIASRVQNSAKRGSIEITESVYQQIRNRGEYLTSFVKTKEFKGIEEKIKIYSVKQHDDSVDFNQLIDYSI